MKKIKANSRVLRLLAFMLIATILLCIVGFSADGWQSMTNTEKNSDNAVVSSGEVDDNTDAEQTAPQLKYYDYLTGEEISEDMLLLKKAAFVMNSGAPMYGISSGDLVIEFPTESADSRLLIYTECINNLGKIGSIAPTRGYISAVAASFGGILIANGTDGRLSSGAVDNFFDLSALTGYSYTEYTKYVYSNHDLIKAGLNNNGFSTRDTVSPTLPYVIEKSELYAPKGDISAQNIVLNFSAVSKTELSYSSENKSYTFSKNGSVKTDLLNDKEISYKNVFILFSDSATYNTEGGSELVMDTEGGGRGYYIRDGFAEEITWKCTAEGKMLFTDKNGYILSVGAGNSYMAFSEYSQLNSFITQ